MNEKTPIFFTADWHLGHKNVLKYDARPFKSIYHMHEVIINNYNASVPENGVCYVLGDAGMCGSGIIEKVLGRLNGTKILVLGNHDKGSSAMYRAGFTAVVSGMYLKIANEWVSMTHAPLRKIQRENVKNMRGAVAGEEWHGASRSKVFALENTGNFHLHGHVHSKPENRVLGKQFDVGVRANKYTPVSISIIESWISNIKRETQ